MSYQSSPAYQKAMLRIMRVSPEQRAIPNSMMEDVNSRFANDALRRELAGQRQAQSTKYANDALGLRVESANLSAQDRRDRLDFRKSQDTLSSLVGVGNLIGSTYLGAKKLGVDSELAKSLYRLRG